MVSGEFVGKECQLLHLVPLLDYKGEPNQKNKKGRLLRTSCNTDTKQQNEPGEIYV